ECTTKNMLEEVRSKCVFTTHTPVSAGHDVFDKHLIIEKVGEYIPKDPEMQIFDGNELNMTHLGLRFSGYVNGVARKHKKVAKKMFPSHDIEFITNGVHSGFWAAEPFCKLFDEYIPSWREDPFSLRGAMNIPEKDIWKAHMGAKKMLIEEVNNKTKLSFDEHKFTIGFARRFVDYKRSDMILSDIERLEKIAEELGDIQIIFSGKAHPDDLRGKELIKKIFLKVREINSKNTRVKIAFLEDYTISIAKLLVSGCDIWLNNPRRPYEASGTSGMKAAINGVPHFSTLDGWWLEGHIENITGWSIGLHPRDPHFDEDESSEDEAEDLYKKLKETVLPMFYKDRKKWMMMMRTCIAINSSFFNTHRVMQQYVMEAYFS
ncbi:alpha-glucan family phosphorylase, partial [Candidatus Woesearchaeota archaeon]|nr:alpha-glucan family phosphorylase [Candidatus Woesearchaeota archaeon]